MRGAALLLLVASAVWVFFPSMGECYAEDRVEPTPLFDVVLGRALQGIRGERIGAEPTPGVAVAADERCDRYDPCKPAGERLDPAEAAYLVPGARQLKVRAVPAQAPELMNPTGKTTGELDLGAKWERSLALLRARRAERARADSSPVATQPAAPVPTFGRADGTAAGAVLLAASGVAGVMSDMLQDLAAFFPPPPANPTATAQPGGPTSCWTQDPNNSQAMIPIETMCYVDSADSGGYGGASGAIPTACWVTDPGTGTSTPVPTMCYEVDTQGQPPNQGGKAVPTMCYVVDPGAQPPGAGPGGPGGEAQQTVCYHADPSGAQPGGIAQQTVCYEADTTSQPPNHGGNAVETMCYTPNGGNGGGDAQATVCYSTSNQPQETVCYATEGTGGTSNPPGGAAVETACHTTSEPPANGESGPGGAAIETVCYTIDDSTGGPPNGQGPDGRDDGGNTTGTAQATVCFTIDDEHGEGGPGTPPDGRDDGGSSSPTDYGGSGNATVCYSPGGTPSSGGTATSTVCYESTGAKPQGDEQETMCYIAVPGQVGGGNAQETVCYLTSGSDPFGVQAATQCYEEGGSGAGGQAKSTECYTHVEIQINKTETASDNFTSRSPNIDIPTRIRWVEEDVTITVTCEYTDHIDGVETYSALTHTWVNSWIYPIGISTARHPSSGCDEVVAKAKDKDGNDVEVGKDQMTVFRVTGHDDAGSLDTATRQTPPRYGVGEVVYCTVTFEPAAVTPADVWEMEWEILSGGGSWLTRDLVAGTGTYVCDDTQGYNELILRFRDAGSSGPPHLANGQTITTFQDRTLCNLEIVRPSGAVYGQGSSGPGGGWYQDTLVTSSPKSTRVVLWLAITLTPTDVSFHNMTFGEKDSTAATASGPSWASLNGHVHTPNWFSGGCARPSGSLGSAVSPDDQSALPTVNEDAAGGFTAHAFTYDIYFRYRVGASGSPHDFSGSITSSGAVTTAGANTKTKNQSHTAAAP